MGAIRSPDQISSDAEQREWTLRFDPPLTGGAVGVRWTVQAPDAHPISGGFSFTIEVADSPSSGETPAAQAVASAADTASTTDASTKSDGADRKSSAAIASEAVPDDSPPVGGDVGQPVHHRGG